MQNGCDLVKKPPDQPSVCVRAALLAPALQIAALSLPQGGKGKKWYHSLRPFRPTEKMWFFTSTREPYSSSPRSADRIEAAEAAAEEGRASSLVGYTV